MGVEGIWKPQKSGTWLCFLKLPRGSTTEGTGGGTGPKTSSKSWVLLRHSGCLSRGRKRAKERSGRRSQVGKSFLGSTRKAGRPQSREGGAGSTPPEAKFQSREGIKAMDRANTIWIPGRWSPRASSGKVPLSNCFRCCPSTSLFPAKPRKKPATQATPLVLRFFFL